MTISDDYMEELNSIKVLAFMEVAPLTDKFQQIVLSEEQVKRLRDSLFKILAPDSDLKDDKVYFDVLTNDKVEVFLPDVTDFYGPTFIKTAREETADE